MEDQLRQLLQTQLENQLSKDGVTWEEAHRRILAQFGSMEGAIGAMERIKADRDDYLLERFQASSEVQIADKQEAYWYEGPIPDQVWDALKGRMESGGLAGAVESIDRHSTEIVEQLSEPHNLNDKRSGLVIGYVQSGKTANYASVVAKAFDAGYKLVIVFAGVLNNLRRQTQGRLIRDLDVHKPVWTELTSMDGDFARVENAVPLVSGSKRLLAVAKKNPTRLQNIQHFLEELPDEKRLNLPILIIDDEADQVTPDSAAKKEEMSKIHAQLREIWSLVGNGSYVSYTATPFANLFMKPDEDDTLYPSNFIHVLPEPDGYYGARKIFGLEEGDEDVAGADAGAEVTRDIPDIDLEEVVPPLGRGADVSEFKATVPPSLRRAVQWFVLATAIRRSRGQGSKHSSMLVHTTPRVEPHFSIQSAIENYRDELSRAVKEDGDWSTLRSLYFQEIERASSFREPEFGEESFDDLKSHIRAVLSDLVTIVDNGAEESEKRLDYPDDRAVTAIVIGGGTLSRGLTLEGLFVSYFTRTSRTYDTLLQMGRWFGFRKGYADLQRIWLSEGLADDYRYLATVEAEIRREIAEMRKAGLKPKDVGVRVRRHPGRLEITGRSKMKFAHKLEVGFEGRRDQTHVLDARLPVLQDNLEQGRRLLSAAKASAAPAQPRSGGAVLLEGVPYEVIREFMEGFRAHPFHGNLHDGTMLKWLDEWDRKLKDGSITGPDPENLWNVVLASGVSGGPEWEYDGVTIHKTRRAAVSGSAPAEARNEDTRSIRALMSDGDHIADIRLLSHAGAPGFEDLELKDDETRALRKKKVQGRGLIVLYVIDKDSKPDANQKGTREALAAPEDVLGYGLIAPVNPHAAAFDRSVFVGVTPTPSAAVEDDEPIEELAPEDTEADHQVEG